MSHDRTNSFAQARCLGPGLTSNTGPRTKTIRFGDDVSASASRPARYPSMLLEHYIESPRLLRYDPHSGLSEEQRRTERADATYPTKDGFFTDSRCGLGGVYASLRGPILFHGTRRFELAEPSTAIELVPGQIENRFTLRQAGVVRAEGAYKRAPRADWGFDSWSAGEESADFFLWLTGQFGTDDFVERFTASSDVSGDA